MLPLDANERYLLDSLMVMKARLNWWRKIIMKLSMVALGELLCLGKLISTSVASHHSENYCTRRTNRGYWLIQVIWILQYMMIQTYLPCVWIGKRHSDPFSMFLLYMQGFWDHIQESQATMLGVWPAGPFVHSLFLTMAAARKHLFEFFQNQWLTASASFNALDSIGISLAFAPLCSFLLFLAADARYSSDYLHIPYFMYQ